LPGDELVPARLDLRKIAQGDALQFCNDLSDLKKHALLLIFRQARPHHRTKLAINARDHEIRPLVAFTFEGDLGDRHSKPAAKLRQRRTLRYELAAKKWRKNLQDKWLIESNNKIGTRGEYLRLFAG
jgi:hypothetical protein